MKKMVLILEGSETFARYTSTMLRSMGYLAVHANSLYTASKHLSKALDLIIVGDDLAGSNTLDAFESLSKATKRATPIMVISRDNSEELKRTLIRKGATEYLTKPLHPSALHSALRNTVEFATGRRTNIRTSLKADIEITVDGKKLNVTATSLSTGGAFLADNLSLAAGQEVIVNLLNLGIPRPIKSKVLYSANAFPSNTVGHAVVFHELEQAERRLIHEFISNHLLSSAHNSCNDLRPDEPTGHHLPSPIAT